MNWLFLGPLIVAIPIVSAAVSLLWVDVPACCPHPDLTPEEDS